MTKRPPKLIFAAILIYAFLIIFAFSMIIGASYLALSVFILLSDNVSAATPYFLLGVGLVGAGYLTNVLLSYFLTKRWSWRFTTGFELKAVPKQKKK